MRSALSAVPRRHARHVATLVLLAVLIATHGALADPRPREPYAGGEAAHAIHRLRTVGSVLYVAAHPDDENTALLAWLTHVRDLRTGYLSLTRGDGGQNLIGPELGAPLGVIRTHELLAARRMDGAEQRFTRALDFGFSKSSDETLQAWQRDSVLADVVWAIRSFQPDVIVTRFPPDSTAGHGHHTASAILAEEAFAAAADPTRFPEQLGRVRPWQAKRLLWNVFAFGRVRPDSTWLVADVGAYDPLLGRSMNEIAGVSRSHHRSQGFGSAERRGTSLQYLVVKQGAPAARDPFEGVDLSWARYPGGAAVGELLARADATFDPRHPERVLPILARAHTAMARLTPEPLVRQRLAELEQCMASCAGLWVEAVVPRPTVTAGETLVVATSVLMRNPADVTLEAVRIDGQERVAARALSPNVALNDTLRIEIPGDRAISQPYWLRTPPIGGLSGVSDRADLGQPENRPAAVARFDLSFAGERVTLTLPVAHRWTEPVQGERWRLLEIVPPGTLRFESAFQLFADPATRSLSVTVQAQRAGLAGELRLEVPEGWTVSPSRMPVTLDLPGREQVVTFRVTPGPGSGVARAVLRTADGREWSQGMQRIDYPHIPVQSLFPPAQLKLVRTALTLRAQRIGYLAGSGDPIAEALRQMGAQVTELTDEDVATGDLSRFDAIVTGVRAYNTRPRLRVLQPRLLDWVAGGGRLVVQYVTTADGPVEGLGPFPFRVSRDRVTREDAAITFNLPTHPLVREPNVLSAQDFTGWVQERGLYFANPWDARYDAVLGSHDPGEPSRDGGLLYAAHGRGAFVYCGYALFRQIPAGVEGGWRLLANLASGARVQVP